ncbi:hypothetical protein HMPREF9056_01897 [Actinomyces sp. oral taxon 170 str. F0386]|nr:hypothetical protein HMPREF9056_01897 [Actinomyces sp. oral taxon 170 str. F0386]
MTVHLLRHHSFCKSLSLLTYTENLLDPITQPTRRTSRQPGR